MSQRLEQSGMAGTGVLVEARAKPVPTWTAGPDLIEVYRHLAGEEWVLRGEDLMPELVRLMSRAKREIMILSGDLRPEFWDRPEFIAMLDDRIAHGVTDIQISFHHALSDTPQEVTSILEEENDHLIALVRKYPRVITLFGSRRFPRLHFTIVDGIHTMNEAPDHKADELPETVFVYNDKIWGANRRERFIAARPFLREIKIGSQ